MAYYTIDDIKRINASKGKHFFSKDTMRFFKSRVSELVYQGMGGIYFVTSEAEPLGGERRYTVRQFDADSGSVETMGEFNSVNRYVAHAAAKELAQSVKDKV